MRVRRRGERVVITHVGPGGPAEVARYQAAGPGSALGRWCRISSTGLGSRPARRTASPALRLAVCDERCRLDVLAGEVEFTSGGRLRR